MQELWALRSRVAAYAQRSGLRPQDAEDVAQEVMLGAWRAVACGRYRPVGDHGVALRRWVFAIAAHWISNERRRAWRRREVCAVERDAADEDERTGPEERLLASENVLRAVKRKPHLLTKRIDGVVCRTMREYLTRSGIALRQRNY